MTGDHAPTPRPSAPRGARPTVLRRARRHQAEPARATSGCPQLLVFSTIQPVMFVLLFRYVFGGAIRARASATSTT